MNKSLFARILPHLIAIVIFLLVAVIFCKPVLDGNVLSQEDITGWKGIAQNSFDYKEKTGHFPLWNPNVFSGMPNYLIALSNPTVLPDLNRFIGLGLPQPINFFFISCLCFYILGLTLGVRSIVAVFGALAFAFCTYNPVIIVVGHVTKMMAIAYMPLLLAGILLIYNKKYWLGLAVTTLGGYFEITANHPQITYYFLLFTFIISIGYLVYWIQKKDWKHIGMAFGLTIIAGLVGVGANSVSSFVTADYSKATMRGGKSITIKGDSVQTAKTTGLDTSYALQYSLTIPEPVITFMPNAFGGSSMDRVDQNSHVVKKLTDKNIPEATAIQVATSLPRYWGGLEYNGGVHYIGVFIILMALLGFVLIKHPLRWGLLAASVLGILLSWGRFFPSFNVFLFNHLPLYSKFRAPSMSLVILELALPISAILAAQNLFFNGNSREFLKMNFKKVLYTMGGLVLLIVLLYLGMSYSSPNDGMIANYIRQMGADNEIARLTISGLKEDRSGLFGEQVLRTIGFIALLLVQLFLFMRKIIKSLLVMVLVIIVAISDLLVIDRIYFNEDKFHPKDEVEAKTTTKTPIDEQILQDKSISYRVYNESGDRFSAGDYHVSAFHKAIGGYHPAKLRIYQDIIERYLSGPYNQQVINMLNTKYIISADPQTGKESLQVNPNAYGPCWLVKHVNLVKDDVQEIQDIGVTNLKDTAIVQQSFASLVAQPSPDSVSTITLRQFDNDEMEYTADCQGPQFAVFSEVYYPYGWNAYIDGKKTEYVRANYVLRGLSIPAGKHTIKFVFEPASYKKGVTVTTICSWLLIIFVLGGLFMAWWQYKKGSKLV